MTKHILTFLLLGALACSEHEGTGPQPIVYKNQIGKIEMTTSESVKMLLFRYDGALPITISEITSKASPLQVTYQTSELKRNGLQAEIKRVSDGKNETAIVTLNDDGTANKITQSGDGSNFDIYYNYFNDYLSTASGNTSRVRYVYEYRISGERCNLETITTYIRDEVNSSQGDKLISTTTFEYGQLKNSTNIDLGMMLRKSVDEMIMEVNFFGMGGRRSSNLPTKMTIQLAGSSEQTVEYTYQTDGDLVRSISSTSLSPNQSSCNYTITYL